MKFVSLYLGPGEIPEIDQVIQEIDMTLMTPLKAAYYLLGSEEFAEGIVENMLFVILGKWKDFQEELIQYVYEIETARKRSEATKQAA